MARALRNAFRKILLPALQEASFAGKHPHYQRRAGDRLELLAIEYDKWGGGFFLEFAPQPAGDLETAWGETVAEADIHVAHTDPRTRARLLAVPSEHGTPNGYFRYEGIAGDRAACEQLVRDVVELLPQVFAWFDDGSLGPNVVAFGS